MQDKNWELNEVKVLYNNEYGNYILVIHSTSIYIEYLLHASTVFGPGL